MANDVRVTNFPVAASHESVALELWRALRDINQSADQQLKFFIDCRAATYGQFTKTS